MARILVSDDDPQVLRLVGFCLESAGHDVVMTRDPSEVAELAVRTAFDAVILDVVMSPMTGFEVMQELRREPATADLPILFLSGRGAGADRVKGLSEGADDYLVKPFEPEELKLRVERLIAWRALRSDRPEPEPALTGGALPSLGRYEVRGVLGEGHMGTVYRGWDPRLERAVALKTLRLDNVPGQDERRAMLDRLHHEAVTVALFNHPHIVAVYDMGDAHGSAFIAMELVDGVSLASYLAEHGALPAERLVPLGLAVARALEAAHSRQVVHHDIKPGNVLLGRDGSIKVTDFGLAELFPKAGAPAAFYGTPGYVPPESLRQEPSTQAGDVFGLGAMLYEAAAGVHPMAGPTLREVLENTLAGRVAPLGERCPDLVPEVATLVMEMLAGDPARRPEAAAVAAALGRVAAEGGWSWPAPGLAETDEPETDEPAS